MAYLVDCVSGKSVQAVVRIISNLIAMWCVKTKNRHRLMGEQICVWIGDGPTSGRAAVLMAKRKAVADQAVINPLFLHF